MKRIIFLVAVALSSFSLAAKEEELDGILHGAAQSVSESIEGRVKAMAVLDVRSEHWALSDYIVETLNHWFSQEMGSGSIVARDEFTLSLIKQESDWQLSGAVSDETIQEIGQALGTDCIVLGEMDDVSGGWQLIVKAVSVETNKVLASWRGKIKSKDKDVKYLIEKSKGARKPPASSAAKKQDTEQTETEVRASIVGPGESSVSVLYPGDVIRIKVSAERNSYLAILCIDANGEESWLPLEDSYIRAGETRVFPDIPGAILRVQDSIFGSEQVVVYAAPEKSRLPRQTKIMGTRALQLAQDMTDVSVSRAEYRVERR